ncbi:unnamed protein product [Phyllotreta striolata]|uniref:Protein N-terminal asparagine amidohydrolase n=1 Tax=Phyllotreta striolata TaxID=444603 RepID=A0A9N9TL62_PHYSR|nr:unnamed protein product [Phyllotreta striolata]
MVLILNGISPTNLPQDTQSLYNDYPVYAKTAGDLLAIPSRVIEPNKLLYVGQSEFAAVLPHDPNVDIIGSDAATTCIIIVLRHSGSGAVALGHFDGSETKEGVVAVIQKLRGLSLARSEGRLELQLIGAYENESSSSEEVFRGIIQAFHEYPDGIHLTLACVGKVITIYDDKKVPKPIIYGIGIRVKSGEMFPATYPDKGPEQHLRSIRSIEALPSQRMVDIYDNESGFLKIQPFHYEPWAHRSCWSNRTDEALLQRYSTSPMAEPPDMAHNIRNMLKFIHEHSARDVFKDNKPLLFRMHSGLWEPLD